MMPTRPMIVSDRSASSPRVSRSPRAWSSKKREAMPRTRRPCEASSSLAFRIRLRQSSSSSTTPAPVRTWVASPTMPSIAPLTKATGRPLCRSVNTLRSNSVCTVLMRLRTESNGRSATRGEARRMAGTSSPASWASCNRAVSVGSPISSSSPPSPTCATASLQSTIAPSMRRAVDGRASRSTASPGLRSTRWSAMSIAVTVIRFSVSVPVLSEQMTVTDPRVSTAGSLRIRALRRSIRCEPMASVNVTTAGRPSGITATATLIAVSTRSVADSPLRAPISTTRPATTTPARASCLPTLSSRCWSGVASLSTSWSRPAMRPSSVCMPVATTMPTPRPAATWVPLYDMQRRSPRATLSWSTGSVSLSTGSDSPVRVASSTRSPATSTKRRSAGTMAPASICTTSPGTSSRAAISTVRPSRTTRTIGTAILRSAAIACSARYSWKNPRRVNNTTMAPIAPASRYLPSSNESTAAPMRISTITAEICSQINRQGLVVPDSAISFGPTSANRRRASSVVRPRSDEPSSLRTSSTERRCQGDAATAGRSRRGDVMSAFQRNDRNVRRRSSRSRCELASRLDLSSVMTTGLVGYSPSVQRSIAAASDHSTGSACGGGRGVGPRGRGIPMSRAP